jgi:glycosyltransferase involved in cell wall biosynthesis
VVRHTAPASHVVERFTGLHYPIVGYDFVQSVRAAARRADVFHAQNSLPLTSAVALMVAAREARGYGSPVRVLTEHISMRVHDSRLEQIFESLAINIAGQASLRFAEAIIPLNPRVGAEIDQMRPGKLAPMIPFGVDTDQYRPPEKGERDRRRAELGWDERPRVLTVGRVDAVKGADMVVRIAEQTAGEVEFVLVGPGEAGDVPVNVEVLGGLAPMQVADLYRASDCLLHPSRAEGFPAVIQEALASGLPVVVADDPGYDRHLEHAPDTVARVARDPAALLGGLRRFDFGRALGDEDRAALAGFAAEQFSWARCAAEHEALYRSLLERDTAASRRW